MKYYFILILLIMNEFDFLMIGGSKVQIWIIDYT
jgi:hypothetical protein